MKKEPVQIPELKALLARVEEKYGQRVDTSTDFESLAVAINKETGEHISSSTLKRLWGYVSLSPAPRVTTLDVLSHYVGSVSFREFCKTQKTGFAEDSDFLRTRFVTSEELTEGDTVTIGWSPDRRVVLRYLGNSRYRVCTSERSKLREGDVFVASQFMIGYPLFLNGIYRGGEVTPPYVAGKKSGLNLLQVS